MSSLFKEVDVRYCSSTHDMVALVDESLSQELLNVLQILLVDDLGKHSQSIGLEHVVVSQLNILRQTTNDNEDFILVHIQLLDQHIYQSSQVLIQLISLRLWYLEQFGDIEEKLTLLILSKDLTLIEQEDDLVQEINALLFLKCLIVEDV